MEENTSMPEQMAGLFSHSKYDMWENYFSNSLSDLLSNEATCTWNPTDLVTRASDIAYASLNALAVAKAALKG